MAPFVGVLDYGMGNLRSVSKSLEAAGAEVAVSDKADLLGTADLLVVPGVGAFRAAMEVLRTKRLDGFIRQWVADEKPYLGICLGLQLLFERSEEAPKEKGLGILKGMVRKFRPENKSLKIPHMGWNQVNWRQGPAKKQGEYFYFVHSFYPAPEDSSIIAAETPYGDSFCSAVSRRNLFATQFHPEKSGETGVRLLKVILKSLARKKAG